MVSVESTTSLSLVKDEIDVTLGEVETYVATFIEDRHNADLLSGSIERLDQVRGAFKLIQAISAQTLAEEMIATCRAVVLESADEADERARRRNDVCLSALSSGLLIISRYLEFVLQHRRMVPVLLIPGINELRRSRGEALLPESHFYTLPVEAEMPPPAGASYAIEQIGAAARRCRQMYQVGLLGALRGQNESSSLQIMGRAADRAYQVCRGYPLARIWWLAGSMLETIAHARLEMTVTRKAILSTLDKYLKQLIYATEPTLNAPVSEADVREMLYLMALCVERSERAAEILEAFKVPELPITEAQLTEERRRLSGPGNAVLHTVADVLREEIGRAKDKLDLSTRMDDDSDFAELTATLKRVGDTLVMLRLEKGGQMLELQTRRLREWDEADHVPSADELSGVADVLLYLESALTAMEKEDGSFSPEMLADRFDEMIAPAELDEATALVVKEIHSHLGLARRAIMEFTETDWDVAHLGNVPATLDTVHGGLVVLKRERAARVSLACRQYIQEKLINEGVHPGEMELEDLADAITSLEYYMEGLSSHKHLGDTILDVAERSLKELGYDATA